MTNSLVLDWLTIQVIVPSQFFDKRVCGYKIEREDFQTRHFKSIYTIRNLHGDEVAVLAADPHANILAFNKGLLKIINKYLYQDDFVSWLKGFLRHLDLKFCNISRIDIALDFEAFDNGLKPETFIQKFITNQFLKRDKSRFSQEGKPVEDYYDIGYKRAMREAKRQRARSRIAAADLDDLEDAPYGLIRRQKEKRADYNRVSVKGNTGSAAGIEFETLKFGSEVSAVTYYMYNKTKELKDRKMKPWIVDNWKANGWNGCGNIWRLEFSIKPSKTRKKFLRSCDIDQECGELKEEDLVTFESLDILEILPEIFAYYLEEHFVFLRNSGKARKTRMQRVSLFKNFNFAPVAIKLSEKRDSQRAAKVFTKQLMELNNELRGYDMNLAIWGNELLTYVVHNRDLHPWFLKKHPDKDLSGYRQMKHSQEAFVIGKMPVPYLGTAKMSLLLSGK